MYTILCVDVYTILYIEGYKTPSISTPIHTQLHTPSYTHTITHTPLQTPLYTHPHTHTNTHTHTHTHTHTQTNKQKTLTHKQKTTTYTHTTYNKHRYPHRKDTNCLTALSLNLLSKAHPRLWSAHGLPSDAHKLVAVPLGGALVVCLNHILYYKQVCVRVYVCVCMRMCVCVYVCVYVVCCC